MWRSVAEVLETAERDDNAGPGIWNRADIEPHTNRSRKYLPRSERQPRPGNFNGRKTTCPKGHPYNDSNTYRRPGKRGRECRACRRERRAEDVGGGS